MLLLFPATTDGPSLTALLISTSSANRLIHSWESWARQDKTRQGEFFLLVAEERRGGPVCVWSAAHGYYLIWAYHSHIADLYNSCHSQVSHSQTFRQEKDQWMCSTESKSNNIWNEKHSSYYISNFYICYSDLSCRIIYIERWDLTVWSPPVLQSLQNWVYCAVKARVIWDWHRICQVVS